MHPEKEDMGRVLAIDYGKKRVGLAVTDPAQIIANKLTTVATNELWDFLQNYFSKETVDEVIIGYPRQLNNQPSEAVTYINPFIKKFKREYPEMNLELMDERFTSKMAFQTMIDGGVSKKGRRNKAMVDAISATIILQNYMEQKRNSF
ncbi:putative holliday junction resolvase [Tangfeifania diversioriginum]|uniref:Putative pre-16S rRNA nuclease n=2 Tax=Tangfeifania diversioriginum TaxID=1168035 RepID=A0A1M6L9D6_9BACT|nr:putative holliday junction resolvase [Tangfeifania diversioriginum]